jgi:hypothetical protein
LANQAARRRYPLADSPFVNRQPPDSDLEIGRFAVRASKQQTRTFMSLSGQSDSSPHLPKPQVRRGSPPQQRPRPRTAAVEAVTTIAWAMTPLIVAAVAALA